MGYYSNMKPNYWQRSTPFERNQNQRLSGTELTAFQLERLNQMLAAILPDNQFYKRKLGDFDFPLTNLDQLAHFPFTFKQELLSEESTHGFAKNLTWPLDRYTRLHRTSGTRGRPLTVLDSPSDWQWWLEAWQPVLDAADVQSSDRVVMAFSFGPFIGFWSAFEAAIERHCLVAPAGAMKSLARIELIREIGATVVFCTPSYALHLAEVASEHQINLPQLPVRALIVAGEPGGSVPEIRAKIESAWGARVVDHAGASEVGPWGFPDPSGRGMYVNEAELIAEFLSIETGELASEGELSELVLTNLGRYGSPVIRYRTGDLVRPTWSDDQECRFVLLCGGVLGRADDMMIIRGVNIYPSAIERILRSFPEIIEYRLTAFRESSLDQLKIEIEDRLANPRRVQEELQVRIGLRVEVETVPMGSLPRFEGKGKRFVDQRTKSSSAPGENR
jgi:phenylacetate-CoA ligase